MHPDLLLEDPDISLAESKVQGVLLLNIHAYKIQVFATTRAALEAPPSFGMTKSLSSCHLKRTQKHHESKDPS
jgi:hypothetical protein